MSVDFGTTPAGLYEDAARASWDAPGTRNIWRDDQEGTYIALMLARPDFRALVDAVWQRATKLQPIEPASAHQDNSMIAPNGDRFFPDNPEDAAVFRDGHDAVPEHPDRWPWPADVFRGISEPVTDAQYADQFRRIAEYEAPEHPDRWPWPAPTQPAVSLERQPVTPTKLGGRSRSDSLAPLLHLGPIALQELLRGAPDSAGETLRVLLRSELVELAAKADQLARMTRATVEATWPGYLAAHPEPEVTP